MEPLQKAVIRIEHWIEHNEAHEREYKSFAEDLKAAGKNESAQQILKTAALTAQGSDALRRALELLK